MSKPTAAQVRRAMKLAGVDIDHDFNRGWYFSLGTSDDDYYKSERSAMIGAWAELTRKFTVVQAVLAEKKKRKKR